ncbi:phage major tail tube protein [Phaeobacter italicus]|jgi:P2 family phage contractile tail tube protein|uniref:phage major tail tube protein n=1 Tax=Phaeobacter italicus TaxID=481446 RepID=UPI00144561CC|nr:phage major tail tube protein [Phaeobacter italicus]MBO9441231.1 phage major tail tube protein [Phaeobacter italicus]MBY5978452.1 phage major tail tube protein [Phaeobacter italicus]NKX42527.1 phage major tail tube protein [Rhodobacteraceae bacterium R_SAG2]
MKATPAFILRNCVLWADNDVKAGQTSDIGLNMPKEKTEKMRNGGMVKDRSIAMGYELEDLEFSLTALDPATIKLMTGRPGTEHAFMVTGALVDEDGTVTSAVYTVRGRLTSSDAGRWKPGDPAEMKCTVVQNYAKLEIGGEEIFEIDDFDYSVGGQSQTGEIRSALLLD